MNKTETYPYDVAEHLRTPEEMAAYLEACIEEAPGDAAFITSALGDIARAKGINQLAQETGVPRDALCKALIGEEGDGFETVLKVIDGLGLRRRAETLDVDAA